MVACGARQFKRSGRWPFKAWPELGSGQAHRTTGVTVLPALPLAEQADQRGYNRAIVMSKR
jgi:hypothetical protein